MTCEVRLLLVLFNEAVESEGCYLAITGIAAILVVRGVSPFVRWHYTTSTTRPSWAIVTWGKMERASVWSADTSS